MKKIIGVLGRPTLDDEKYSVIGIYNTVRTAIIKKGCIPFMIMPMADVDYAKDEKKTIPELSEEEKETLRFMVDHCDGILIPGGYQWFYYDEYVVAYAISQDIPVLGICMGMQLLGTYDNACVSTELIDSDINHNQHNVQYAHKIKIQKGTRLYQIIGENEISVNSKHRYALSRVNKFLISAISEDGYIEGIEMPNKKFVVGVQWHPENMLDYDIKANKIFDAFIESCNKR